MVLIELTHGSFRMGRVISAGFKEDGTLVTTLEDSDGLIWLKVGTEGLHPPSVLQTHCMHCGQNRDLCLCNGNRYDERRDNTGESNEPEV